MNVPIKLKDIVDAMDMVSDEASSYYERKTGEILYIQHDEFQAADSNEDLEEYPDWEKDTIKKAKEILDNEDDFVCLPEKFDIHEYSIMKDFCFSIKDEDVSNRLLRAIQGSGAFRRFKDLLYDINLVDEWYAYREKKFYEIAAEWCQDNKILYVLDGKQEKVKDI